MINRICKRVYLNIVLTEHTVRLYLRIIIIIINNFIIIATTIVFLIIRLILLI